MSALATAALVPEAAEPLAGAEGDEGGPISARLFEPGGATLEELISEAWDDLAAEGCAECPVCRETMVVTGCDRCGSELS